jgi:adenylosuccinate synthase
MKKAIVTVGLGFGDEGKGATVDFLARELDADLVVRYCGGSQAGHNVELPDGRRHTFSQFGAGTLAGARTYLSQHVVIHPGALEAEAEHLESLGVRRPLEKHFVHPAALVTTDFAQAMNRLRELARGDARHGSCGHGIGETRSYWLKYGEDAITAGDLADRGVLWDKLELQRQRLLLELQTISCDSPQARRLASDFFERSARDAAHQMHAVGVRLQFSATVPECRTAIFEGAQGVLLDEWRGFHPYTTWSTVTQHHALELVAEAEADELCALGVTRAYATRHGAGPFPTEDPSIELSDDGNPWNAWQHGIRFGHLDVVLLEYAIAACGGTLDGLVVNCLDQVGDQARVCVAYDGVAGFSPSAIPSLKLQEELGEILFRARPLYQEMMADELQGILREFAPLAVLGRGRTWRDRALETLSFRSRTHVSLEAEESLTALAADRA